MAEKKAKKAKNLGGRPPKPFDREQAKKLMAIWCTKDEVAGYFEMSVPTLERKCYDWAREIGFKDGSFETLRNIYGANTKASVRRTQIATAIENRNPTMLIWLGKQLLGQSEHADTFVGDPLNLNYKLDDL